MVKRLNAEIQKPKIIESFYQTILDEGFEGASIAKIAARIDMNPTLIIHYFGTKENLTAALVDHVIDLYGKLIKSALSGEQDPKKRLMKLLRTIWSRSYYDKTHISTSHSVLSAGFRNPRINRKIKTLYSQYKRLLVKEFSELKEDGVIGVDDVDGAVEALITMIEGARHFKLYVVKTKDLDAYNERMIETVLRLLEYRDRESTEKETFVPMAVSDS